MNITIKLNKDNDFVIKAEEYNQPLTKYGNMPLIIMGQWLYSSLQAFAANIGTTIDSDKESGVDPITLITDMLYYGPDKFITRLFNNATVKKWIRNENTKHTADLACVLQWAGSGLGGKYCDAMWSSFNAIKAHVYNNWSKDNVAKFWELID